MTHPLWYGLYIAQFMSPENAPGLFGLLYHEMLSHHIIYSHNFVRLTNPDISHQNLAPLPKMKILRDIFDSRLVILGFEMERK